MILKNIVIYLLLTLSTIFVGYLTYGQEKSGLLKNEPIVTYWNKQQNQVRSIGQYKIDGVLRIGSKIGIWKYFYTNGEKQEISNYYDGYLNGKYKSYYANGKLKINGNFTLGAPDSTFEAYFFNGKLAEKGKYKIHPFVNPNDSNQLNKNIGNAEAIKSYKTGDWFYFYNNGKIMEQTYFKASDTTEYIRSHNDTNGVKVVSNGFGTLKTYFPSGKIKTLLTIENGVKNGKFILYKPNGEIRKSGFYNKGKIDSIWEETFITSSQLYQISSYKNGNKNGIFREYKVDGEVLIDGTYTNGKKNGEWTYYYTNNNIDMQGGFKKDLQHGYWKFFYPKGQIYYEGEFIKGEKDGDWKFYYNNGITWRSGTYRHNQKNGLWTTLYESGDKSMEGNFKNDLEDGLWKSWYENGQLKDEGTFINGKMNAGWKGYYTNGQLKYEGKYDNDLKIDKWIYWSNKGLLIEKRNYKLKSIRSALIPDETRVLKKSVKHGECLRYSEYDGSIKSVENYNEGNLNGVSKYFYPGGVITSSKVTYKNGLLNGTYTAYNRKGRVTSETSYKDNKKHGDMKVYNRRGKLVLHVIYKEGVKVKDILKKITFKYSGPKTKK